MTKYHVTALRWEHGWELHYKDHVTQSHTLDAAPREFRSWLRLMEGHDCADEDVVVTVDKTSLAADYEAAKMENERVQAEIPKAAQHMRETMRALKDQGLSLADIGALFGVTKARVQKVLNHA